MIRRLWRRCLLRWRLRRIAADPYYNIDDIQDPQTFETLSSYRTEIYNSLIESRRQCLQQELARIEAEIEAGIILNMQRGVISDTSRGSGGTSSLQHYYYMPGRPWRLSTHSNIITKKLSKKEDIDFINNVKEEI